MKIAIIGGGAAGFFSAITTKEHYPQARVVIFEKSKTLLSKVKISGGGRCNVTNGCTDIEELCKAYPRGGRQLKKLFGTFSTKETMEWFESRGVPLIIQEDNCVFPLSQDSQSIINCFLSEARKLGIEIFSGMGVKSLKAVNDKLEIKFLNDDLPSEVFEKVIVTTGGSPKKEGLDWLKEMGHLIEEPVPSLFSFNITGTEVNNLMGVVVENTIVSIQGTKTKAKGPILITHWGMSGPAILKLSSHGARILSSANYKFNLLVNWADEPNCDTVTSEIQKIIASHPGKMLSSIRPYSLPQRLWLFLLEKIEISPDKKWGEVGKKGVNKLMTILTNDSYAVKGKSTFSEEFVTCGGVSLQSIDLATLQSKACKNLYFAGEVMDIDAITGGYNLQAAWTTGYTAGLLKLS